MAGSRPFTRVVILLGAAFSLVSACGDDDSADSDTPAVDTDAPSDSDAPSDTEAPVTDSPDTDGDFGDVPSDILEATYASGSAHVEMSGDQDGTVDFSNGGGFTEGETTFASFGDDAGNGLAINFGGPAAESGIAVNINGVTSGGDFEALCDLQVTENSDSEFAGTFTCDNIDAVSADGTFKVDVAGTFSVKP